MVRVEVWDNGASALGWYRPSVLVPQRRWMVNLAVYLFNYFQFR